MQEFDINILSGGQEVAIEKEEKLNIEQEQFCYLYIFDEKDSGNATACYMKAYGVESKDSASASAAKLLALDKIQKKTRSLLRAKGLNAEWLDNRLMDLAKASNKKINIEAIKELNRVQGRIVSKQQTTIIDANKLLEQMRRGNMPSEGYAG